MTQAALSPLAAQYEDCAYALGPFQELLAAIRPEDRLILDIGCGAGDNARALGERGHTVHGVTLSEKERAIASRFLARVVVADAESWEPDYPAGHFDALLFSHVLEHFVEPAAALRRLARWLKPGGRVYIGLPNVAYWRQRLHFLAGRFDYADQGVLDATHLRFFTWFTAQQLVADAGLCLETAFGVGHCPLPLVRRLAPGMARHCDRWALRRFPNLLAHSLVLIASR